MIIALALVALVAKQPARSIEQPGQLDLSFSCQLQPNRIVQASVWGRQVDGSGMFSASFKGRPAVIARHHFKFSVPTGVYHYGVNVSICGFHYYAVALPGFVWQDHVELLSGVGDPQTPMFVAGFKPLNVSVTLYRNEAASSVCGSNVVAADLTAARTTVRDSGKAYYASSLDYGSERSAVPHVLKITWASGEIRFLASDLEEPEETFAGDPTYRRLDLSSDVLARLLKMPDDELNCL